MKRLFFSGPPKNDTEDFPYAVYAQWARPTPGSDFADITEGGGGAHNVGHAHPRLHLVL